MAGLCSGKVNAQAIDDAQTDLMAVDGVEKHEIVQALQTLLLV